MGHSRPFLDGQSATETDQHMRMKNTAVFWLLSQGIDLDQIYHELSTGYGKLDVAAVLDDGSMIAVECDRSTNTAGRRSSMLQDGHQVFSLTLDGLYELVGRWGVKRAIDCQLSLGPSNIPRYGRWFANGRDADAVDVGEYGRWSFTGQNDTWFEDPRGPRWAANGEKKPEKSLTELPEKEAMELISNRETPPE